MTIAEKLTANIKDAVELPNGSVEQEAALKEAIVLISQIYGKAKADNGETLDVATFIGFSLLCLVLDQGYSPNMMAVIQQIAGTCTSFINDGKEED